MVGVLGSGNFYCDVGFCYLVKRFICSCDLDGKLMLGCSDYSVVLFV